MSSLGIGCHEINLGLSGPIGWSDGRNGKIQDNINTTPLLVLWGSFASISLTQHSGEGLQNHGYMI